MVLLPGCQCCGGCVSVCPEQTSSVSIRFQMAAASGNALRDAGPFPVYYIWDFGTTYTPDDLWPINAAALDETVIIDLTSGTDYSVAGSYSANGSSIGASLQNGETVCKKVYFYADIRTSSVPWTYTLPADYYPPPTNTVPVYERILIQHPPNSIQPYARQDLYGVAPLSVGISQTWRSMTGYNQYNQPGFGFPVGNIPTFKQEVRTVGEGQSCGSPSSSWSLSASESSNYFATGDSYDSFFTKYAGQSYGYRLPLRRILPDVTVTITLN